MVCASRGGYSVSEWGIQIGRRANLRRVRLRKRLFRAYYGKSSQLRWWDYPAIPAFGSERCSVDNRIRMFCCRFLSGKQIHVDLQFVPWGGVSGS